jgi:hypothetical protein
VTRAAFGWRATLRRDSLHPVVPPLIALAWFVIVAAVALIAPQAFRNEVTVGAGALLLIGSYWIWPKPTLLVFAFALLLQDSLSRWTGADVGYLDEVLVPSFVLLALVRERPWQKSLVDPVRDISIVGFLVMGILSSLVAGVPTTVWVLGLLLLVKVFAFLYVVVWHDFTADDVRQLYPTALGVGIIVALLSVFELVAPVAFRETLNLVNVAVPRSGLPSLSSITGHPSTYSWFMAFNALFLFAGYVFLRRWWLLVGGTLFAIGTVLSARRRAIAGMAVALLAGFASSFRRTDRAAHMRAWVGVGLAGVIVAGFFIPSLVGLVELTSDEAEAGAATARVALYETSVKIAADELPLGAGLGRFGSGLSRDPYSPVYHEYGLDTVRGLTPEFNPFVADVFWARVLGETGVLGFAALVMFCIAVAAGLWRATRTSFPEPIVAAFVLGAWMVFVQAIVDTLASSLFESPPRVYLLFGVVGAALSLARVVRKEA